MCLLHQFDWHVNETGTQRVRPARAGRGSYKGDAERRWHDHTGERWNERQTPLRPGPQTNRIESVVGADAGEAAMHAQANATDRVLVVHPEKAATSQRRD
jgi:hypothetical protein